VFSKGYEARFANFRQRLSQKKESEDSAVLTAVPLSAVSGADERGTVAGGRGTAVVDAAGNRLAQIAREGRPRWALPTLIALTRVSKRAGAALARSFFLQAPPVFTEHSEEPLLTLIVIG